MLLLILLLLLLLWEVGHSRGRAGWRSSRLPVWWCDAQMCSITNFIAAQRFEFSFPKANHFQRGIRDIWVSRSKQQAVTIRLKQHGLIMQQLKWEGNVLDSSWLIFQRFFLGIRPCWPHLSCSDMEMRTYFQAHARECCCDVPPRLIAFAQSSSLRMTSTEGWWGSWGLSYWAGTKACPLFTFPVLLISFLMRLLCTNWSFLYFPSSLTVLLVIFWSFSRCVAPYPTNPSLAAPRSCWHLFPQGRAGGSFVSKQFICFPFISPPYLLYYPAHPIRRAAISPDCASQEFRPFRCHPFFISCTPSLSWAPQMPLIASHRSWLSEEQQRNHGVPLAKDETKGPSGVTTFSCTELALGRMGSFLPLDKHRNLKQMLAKHQTNIYF